MNQQNDVRFQTIVILGLKTALLEAESEINRLRNKLSEVEHVALQWYVKCGKAQVRVMEKRTKLVELKNKLQQELKVARSEIEEQKKDMADKENENINLRFKVKEIKSLLDIKVELLESLNIKGDKVDKNTFNDHRSDYKMLLKNLRTVIKNQPCYPDHQVLDDIRKFLYKIDRGKSIDISKYMIRKIKTEKKDGNDGDNDVLNAEKDREEDDEKSKRTDVRFENNDDTGEDLQLSNSDEKGAFDCTELKTVSNFIPTENNILKTDEKLLPFSNPNNKFNRNAFDEATEISVEPVRVNTTGTIKDEENFVSIETSVSKRTLLTSPLMDIVSDNAMVDSKHLVPGEISLSKHTDLTLPLIDVMSDSEGDETSGFCEGEAEAESPTDMDFCSSHQTRRSIPSPNDRASTQCMPDLIPGTFPSSTDNSESQSVSYPANSKVPLPDMNPLESSILPDSFPKSLPHVEDISKPHEVESRVDQKIREILDEMITQKELTFQFIQLKQFKAENENELKGDHFTLPENSSLAVHQNRNSDPIVQNSALPLYEKRPVKFVEVDVCVKNKNSTSSVTTDKLPNKVLLSTSILPNLNDGNVTETDVDGFKKPIGVLSEKHSRTKKVSPSNVEKTVLSNRIALASDNLSPRNEDKLPAQDDCSKNLSEDPLKPRQPDESEMEIRKASKYLHVSASTNKEDTCIQTATIEVKTIAGECEEFLVEQNDEFSVRENKINGLENDEIGLAKPISNETTIQTIRDENVRKNLEQNEIPNPCSEDLVNENEEPAKQCSSRSIENSSSVELLPKVKKDVHEVIGDEENKLSNTSDTEKNSRLLRSKSTTHSKNSDLSAKKETTLFGTDSDQPALARKSCKNNRREECASEPRIKAAENLKSKIEVVANVSTISNSPVSKSPQRRKTIKSKIVVKSPDPVVDTNVEEIPATMNNGMERRKRKGKFSEILDSLKSKSKRRKLSDDEVEALPKMVLHEKPRRGSCKSRKPSVNEAVSPPKTKSSVTPRRGRRKNCSEITEKAEVVTLENLSSPQTKRASNAKAKNPNVFEAQQPIEIVSLAPKKIEISSELEIIQNVSVVDPESDTEMQTVLGAEPELKADDKEKFTVIENNLKITPESEKCEERLPQVKSSLFVEVVKSSEVKPNGEILIDMTAPFENDFVVEEPINEAETGDVSFGVERRNEMTEEAGSGIKLEVRDTSSGIENQVKPKNGIVLEVEKLDKLNEIPSKVVNQSKNIPKIETTLPPCVEKKNSAKIFAYMERKSEHVPEMKNVPKTTVLEDSTRRAPASKDSMSDDEPIEMSSKLGYETLVISEKLEPVDSSLISQNTIGTISPTKAAFIAKVVKKTELLSEVLVSESKHEIETPQKLVENGIVESLFENNDFEKLDVFSIIEEMMVLQKCSLERYKELIEFMKPDPKPVSPTVEQTNRNTLTETITSSESSNVHSHSDNKRIVDETSLMEESEDDDDDDSENEMLIIADDDQANNSGLAGIETNTFNCQNTSKSNVSHLASSSRLLAPHLPTYCAPVQNKSLEPAQSSCYRSTTCPMDVQKATVANSSVLDEITSEAFSESSSNLANGIEKDARPVLNEANPPKFQFYKESKVESPQLVVEEMTPFEKVWGTIKSMRIKKPPPDENVNLIPCYKPVTHLAFRYRRKYNDAKSLRHKNEVFKIKKIKENINKFIKEVPANQYVAVLNFKTSVKSVDPLAIAIGVMSVTITCGKQKMDHLMRTSEHLVTLCFELKNEFSDFVTDVKTVIKDKIFTNTWNTTEYNTNMVAGIIALSVFYTILCKRDDDLKSIEELMYECLCSKKYSAHPIAFGVLSVYPNIFNETSRNCLLSEIILFTLINHNMKYNTELYKVPDVHLIIESYYNIKLGYKAAEDHAREAMYRLNDDTWVDAVVLLCKRQQFPWSYRNVITKYLLEIVNRWREHDFDEMVLIKAVEALHRIIRSCPKKTMNGVQETAAASEGACAQPQFQSYNLNSIVNSLSRVLSCTKGSRELHETVAFAICEISYLCFERCSEILKGWKPMDDLISSKALERLNSSMKRAMICPDWYQFVAPPDTAVVFKAKKNRKISSESQNGIIRVGMPKNSNVLKEPPSNKKNKKKKKGKR